MHRWTASANDLQNSRKHSNKTHIGVILFIIVSLLLVGGLPKWGHSHSWGNSPSGVLGLMLPILVVLLMGYPPRGF